MKRAFRGAVRAVAGVLLLAALAAPAQAIERIRARIDSVTVAGVTARGITADFAIPSSRRSVLTAQAAVVELPAAARAQVGRLSALRLRCENPLVREPLVACPLLRLDARAARLPPLHLEAYTRVDTRSGRLEMRGQGPQLAGETLAFSFEGTPRNWDAAASLPAVDLAELRKLIAPWYVPPPQFVPRGRAALSFTAGAIRGEPSAALEAQLSGIEYANEASTVVAEKLRGALRVNLTSLEKREFGVALEATGGQVLAGPVFLDLGANPLHLEGAVHPEDERVRLTGLALRQPGVAEAGGTAVLHLDPFQVEAARLDVARLEFPGAYRSLLQIALTTTPFAQLATGGSASGSVQITANQPTAIDLQLHGIALADPTRSLELDGVEADLHWARDLTGPPRTSWISWEGASGWGITGGASRIDFLTQDRDVRLLRQARLPLWDGALIVEQLQALRLGTDQFAGSFQAHLEPISLQQVTRALGWTEFGGQLSGRIPGLTYRDGLLSVQGDLEAEVFDGRVVARNLRVREPFGAWPRLFADVSARGIDLELLTRTFEFGNITGRLDGDLTGLETFGWSPVAFDLRLATPAGDRSRRRISQKAVKNLSSIGGSGSGVASALQSGALRFFENFRYERIGLTCRLHDDVCEMGGVGEARDGGYYIVKGSGLPRIDIIGNQHRVDWPRLLAQVKTALANTEEIVIEGSRGDSRRSP